MPYDDCELTEGVTYEVLPENEFTKQIPSFSQGFVRLQPYNQVTDHMYCAVQKNSVPAAAGAVATSHTVFLLNRVLRSVHLWVRKWVKTALFMLRLPRVFAPVIWAGAQPHQYVTPCPKFYTTQYKRFIYADTGWVKDGDNSNYPLISGIGWRIRIIFHVLNKQRLRFDLVYRTLGYIFMYLGESGISLRQASKKAKLDRNSLINNLKNVTFNITFWINFHHFCMQNVIKMTFHSHRLNISDMISHSCYC